MLIVKPVQLVLQIFLVPAGSRGLGPVFPFLWFCKDGGSVWAAIIIGVQFPTHALRELCGLHSTLSIVVPSWYQ